MSKKPFAHTPNMWELIVKKKKQTYFFGTRVCTITFHKGGQERNCFQSWPGTGSVSVTILSDKGSASDTILEDVLLFFLLVCAPSSLLPSGNHTLLSALQ